MKPTRLTLLLLLSTLPVFGQVGNAGPKDYAKGSGVGLAPLSFSPEEVEFSFNVESDPAGGSPKGTMQLRRKNGSHYRATVTCLGVLKNPVSPSGPQVGHSALIIGDIVETNGTESLDGLIFYISDTSEGDLFMATFTSDSTGQGTCVPTFTVTPVVQGEIVINDE